MTTCNLYHAVQKNPNDYRAIALWGRNLMSFGYYIHEQQARASRERAPVDAIYRQDDGKWATLRDLKRDHPFLAQCARAGVLPVEPLSYDDVMQLLWDCAPIDVSQIPADVLARKVWMSGNGMPGCLYDSLNYHRTKAEAIESCVFVSGEGNDPDDKSTRGIKTALRKFGYFQTPEGYEYVVRQVTLREVL